MTGVPGPQWTVRARGVLVAMRGTAAGQAVLFTAIGGLTTASNAVVYLLLRGTFPTGLANVLALLLTTIGSSLLHKRVVFTGLPERPLRMHLQTAATFLFYCVSSSAALILLTLVDDDPGSLAEALAVAAMSTVGGVARFVALRLWVFRRTRRGHRGKAERPTPIGEFVPGAALVGCGSAPRFPPYREKEVTPRA